MKNMNEDLGVRPVAKYNAPKYPAYTETRGNPALLKKLPSRWEKNARVIACIGLMGSIALSSCATQIPGGITPNTGTTLGSINDIDLHHGGAAMPPVYVVYPTEQEAYTRIEGRANDIVVRTHHGGGGGGPIYVAYLTEQEALSIIRAEAEAAGLRLGAIPPDYNVEVWGEAVGLDLFDEDKSVGFALINKDGSNFNFWYGVGIANEAMAEFARLHNINVGIFDNPGETVGWDIPERLESEYFEAKEVTVEGKAQAAIDLEAQLAAQVREFIEQLQAQGILEHEPEERESEE